MPYTILILSHHKPGTSLEHFKSHYETKHIPLIRQLSGDTFPQSHIRHYLQRDENGQIISLVPGKAGDGRMMDCDALAILTFENQDNFGQFMGKVTQKEAARKRACS